MNKIKKFKSNIDLRIHSTPELSPILKNKHNVF
jgi:hypothetical protein